MGRGLGGPLNDPRLERLGEHATRIGLGGVSVTAVCEARARWEPRLQGGACEAPAAVTITFHGFIVEAPDRLVVVETGAGNDPRAARYHARWRDFERLTSIEVVLAGLGKSARDVDDVVLTHAHADHVLSALAGPRELRFPSARHWLGAADVHVDGAPDEVRRPVDELAASGLLSTWDRATSLGSALTLVPAPGETRGHGIVHVQGSDDGLLLLGDLVHLPLEIDDPAHAPPGRDLASLGESRARIFARAVEEGCVVAATHFLHPPFGRIEDRHRGRRWRAFAAPDLGINRR